MLTWHRDEGDILMCLAELQAEKLRYKDWLRKLQVALPKRFEQFGALVRHHHDIISYAHK